MKHSRQPVKCLWGAFALTLLLSFTNAASAQTFTCCVADGQYLNVRKQPSSTAATWGVMRTGETIEAEPAEIRNGFFKTVFMEHEAYVSVSYFEIAVNEDYTVAANGRVRVRETPGGKASGFIQPGETVRVRAWRYAADGTKWARCPGPRYIAAEYLTPAK